MIIESICFKKHPWKKHPTVTDEWVKQEADNWCDFIQSQHPKDEVFVIEKMEKGE